MNAHIIITGGVLSMSDGSDVTEYLQAWQLRRGIPDGSHVNILDSDTAQQWAADVRLLKGYAS